ncbi:hypothetical protein C8R43DRAFT_1063787 [Mycena crocata]|nr:hypothetical protein C8R43DRAFT_1063787 [Mycena crocata]
MHAFAQELVDHVIDCCHGQDPGVMKSCGLVSKRWLSRSRYHLFSEVTLKPANLPSFVDLVEGSPLPLLCFIRRLELHHHPNFDGVLLTRLCCCPNLTEIILDIHSSGSARELERLNTDESLRNHICALGNNATSLSTLSMELSGMGAPLNTITAIISCVPRIKKLRLGQMHLTSEGTLPPPLPLELERLVLNNDSGHSFLFAWLLTFPTVPRLKELTLAGFPISRDRSLEAYFHHAGGDLWKLDLTRLMCLIFDIVSVVMQIVPYTSSLRDISCSCGSPSDALQLLPLFPSTVSNIRIQMGLTGEDASPWREIDTLLDQPRFKSLRRLFISYWASGIRPSVTKRLLPLADARGILSD